MPHWRENMDSPHLGSWDLEGRGDVEVEIEDVKSATLKGPGGEQKRNCIKFKGAKKTFIANATNCKVIERVTGTSDYTKWPGHKITLYVTEVDSPQGTTPAIRVRPKK